MTNYYIKQDNTIVLADEDLSRLENTISFIPQLANLELLETDREIIQRNPSD